MVCNTPVMRLLILFTPIGIAQFKLAYYFPLRKVSCRPSFQCCGSLGLHICYHLLESRRCFLPRTLERSRIIEAINSYHENWNNDSRWCCIFCLAFWHVDDVFTGT